MILVRDNILESFGITLKKGGMKVGTVRVYHDKDGNVTSVSQKIKDTGGAGDWVNLSQEQISRLPNHYWFTSPHTNKKDLTNKIKIGESGTIIPVVIKDEIKNEEKIIKINPTEQLEEKIEKNINTEQSEELNKESKKEFTPCPYQQAIFDFVEFGSGNAVINAVAGSGKTTTIIKALSKIPPNAKVKFLAFNKSIVEELEKRVPKNVSVQTLHSLGDSGLRKKFGKMGKMDKWKTWNIIDNQSKNWQQEQQKNDFKDRVNKLVHLSKMNLCSSLKEINELAEKHDIDNLLGETEKVMGVLETSKRNKHEWDFADMIYTAATDDGVVFEKYDYVFVDECQDLNKAQQVLFKKLLGPNSRFIAVGDPQQSIYGFAGADIDSFKRLKESENTIELPLSVSYRCGQEIVNLAKEIVPHLESREGAHKGEVTSSSIGEIKGGDMVLCRNTAPIVKLCLQFIACNRKAFVKGGDIGKNLIGIITKSKQETLQGFFNYLREEYINISNKVKAKNANLSTQQIQESTSVRLFGEKMIVFQAISDSTFNVRNTKDLSNAISLIFKDKDNGVCFSTIHKSKGLESDNVYIVDAQLMPSKYATKDWQIIQESNLKYVAITRAKNKLGIINDWHFKNKHTIDYVKEKLNAK